ncbi:hypothetical protein [Vibrio rumoiensis]|uniref:MSHA biogenesis protein MshK n=1 Tax=Vibrio rumoiensis 1S-45 TaxID=1188252 RepID=A0A1E5E570_9VIBR|nr:hypothetical protein [Vibrio rumoiensis]OEF28476.1 hypothetical protein A1QC_05445 [Vibrio rumoiensis 1S-45]
MDRALLFSLLVMVSSSVFAEKDPTAPLDWMTGQSAKPSKQVYYKVPTLQSIVCDAGTDCHAVVDNKIVSKGQVVSGYKVTDINSQHVALTRGSKTWNLELFSQVKKN